MLIVFKSRTINSIMVHFQKYWLLKAMPVLIDMFIFLAFSINFSAAFKKGPKSLYWRYAKGPSLYYVRVFWGFFEPPTHLRKDIFTT